MVRETLSIFFILIGFLLLLCSILTVIFQGGKGERDNSVKMNFKDLFTLSMFCLVYQFTTLQRFQDLLGVILELITAKTPFRHLRSYQCEF